MPADRCPTCGSERAEVRLFVPVCAGSISPEPCDNEAFHERPEQEAERLRVTSEGRTLQEEFPPSQAAHEAIGRLAQFVGAHGAEVVTDTHAALDAAVEDAYQHGRQDEAGDRT